MPEPTAHEGNVGPWAPAQPTAELAAPAPSEAPAPEAEDETEAEATPAPAAEQEDSGLSGGAIAGIVIGVLAVIGGVAGTATVYLRRRRDDRWAAAESATEITG